LILPLHFIDTYITPLFDFIFAFDYCQRCHLFIDHFFAIFIFMIDYFASFQLRRFRRLTPCRRRI
jgi:hypothetical protein